jgi:glutathione S-transferase
MENETMAKIDNPESPIPAALEGLHLFHFDAAPCAQRVRFALGEKGLARGREEKFDAVTPSAVKGEADRWVSRMVSLVQKQHMTKTYAGIHPNMVVPALVHDGKLILESMDIIEYLDDAFGGAALIPKQADLRAATMQRVEQAKELHRSIRYVSFYWGLGRLAILNTKERGQLAQLAGQGNDGENLVAFYDGYSNQSIPKSVYLEHLKKLYDAFTELDQELTDGRQFLMSDEVSIADAFWSMKILKLLEVGYPVENYHPNLYTWYQRIYQRPSFQNEVMAKNHLLNRFFRAKSFVENFLGLGIKKALVEIAS